jgi:hypothetical protein
MGLLAAPDDHTDVPATVAPAAASILSSMVEHDGPVAVVDVASVLALRGQLAQARPSY